MDHKRGVREKEAQDELALSSRSSVRDVGDGRIRP